MLHSGVHQDHIIYQLNTGILEKNTHEGCLDISEALKSRLYMVAGNSGLGYIYNAVLDT